MTVRLVSHQLRRGQIDADERQVRPENAVPNRALHVLRWHAVPCGMGCRNERTLPRVRIATEPDARIAPWNHAACRARSSSATTGTPFGMTSLCSMIGRLNVECPAAPEMIVTALRAISAKPTSTSVARKSGRLNVLANRPLRRSCLAERSESLPTAVTCDDAASLCSWRFLPLATNFAIAYYIIVELLAHVKQYLRLGVLANVLQNITGRKH